MNRKKILFVVGPTAVGKTDIACLLASRINAEIISCDSAQVYHELSVVSNKPSDEILKKYPHHVIDVVSIAQEFNVASFRRRAIRAINQIHKKNKVPLICGGSGLYMSILLDGIFQEKSRDPLIRKRLEAEARVKGMGVLYRRLCCKDRQAAAKIHSHDTRRIIRALEVIAASKQAISQLQKKRSGLWEKYDIRIFALNRERDKLYTRINRRVDDMIKGGLIEEIRALRDHRWSKTASTLIGVREIKGYLNGEHVLQDALELMKRNTRRLAKRQLTWFRKDKRLQWILIQDRQAPQSIVRQILKDWKVRG